MRMRAVTVLVLQVVIGQVSDASGAFLITERGLFFCVVSQRRLHHACANHATNLTRPGIARGRGCNQPARTQWVSLAEAFA